MDIGFRSIRCYYLFWIILFFLGLYTVSGEDDLDERLGEEYERFNSHSERFSQGEGFPEGEGFPLGEGFPPKNEGFPEEEPHLRRPTNRKLMITTLLDPPYVMLKKNSAFLMGNDKFEGYVADIVARLAAGIGFMYELRLARDGRYGGPGENNTWTGMIGELVNGDADLAAGPLVVTADRSRVVSFTDPFLEFRYTAVIKKPRRRKARVRTAEKLLDSDLQYGVVQGSIAQKLFQKTDNLTNQRLWGRMATFWPSVFVQSVQEGVERARREDYAFVLDSPAAEYISNRRPCDLYTIEPFLDKQHFSLALRKDDPLKERINRELKRMVLNEDMTSIYLKWWHGECPHKGGRGSGSRSRDARTGPSKSRGRHVTTEPNPWRHATAGAIQSGPSCASHVYSIVHVHRYFIMLISSLFIYRVNLLRCQLFYFVIK